jgi:hypothetical protein
MKEKTEKVKVKWIIEKPRAIKTEKNQEKNR